MTCSTAGIQTCTRARPMTEHELQNAIRVYISKHHLGVIFRGNVGKAWTGIPHRTPDGLLLREYRPFSTGLPVGFPDLFGFRTITITPDMVGQKIALFCGLEIKTKTGRVRPEQVRMLDFMQSSGCLSGIARSTADAGEILRKEELLCKPIT